MKKDIAIIIRKLSGGGAERAAANLSLILSTRYNVHLIVFDGNDRSYTHGGVLHDLQLPSQKGKIRKLIQLLHRAIKIRAIKKENNIVCSISLLEGASVVNILSRVNDKVFCSIRNHLSTITNNQDIKSKSSKLVIHFIAHQSNKIVAVSYDVMKDCIENWGMRQEKTIEIPNMCDFERLICNVKGDVNLREGHQNFIVMGRLTPQKGHSNLFRAFTEVIKKYPNANLYLLGDGELKPNLEKLAYELGITEHVIFLGYHTNPHEYLKAADIFVLPSLAEGMSNALLEALAFGMPCIATDCHSGMREILSLDLAYKGVLEKIEVAEYGILTSVSNENIYDIETELTRPEHQLAEAMELMLANDCLRKQYKCKALERIQEYTPDSIAQQWIDQIESSQ